MRTVVRLGKTYVQRNGDDTSRAAAISAIASAESDTGRVLAFAHEVGERGFTDDEAAAMLQERYGRGISPNHAATRRMTLSDAGVVVKSGRKRRTRRGREANVWVLAKYGPPKKKIVRRKKPMSEAQRPTPGRIVHYQTDERNGHSYWLPAIVTITAADNWVRGDGTVPVPSDDMSCHLTVLGPNGPYVEWDVPHGNQQIARSWRWPERV